MARSTSSPTPQAGSPPTLSTKASCWRRSRRSRCAPTTTGARRETLRDGLQSNREIGKAVGLLMAFHQISDDDAFGMLRKASQDMNIKLADVARQVVDHHRAADR